MKFYYTFLSLTLLLLNCDVSESTDTKDNSISSFPNNQQYKQVLEVEGGHKYENNEIISTITDTFLISDYNHEYYIEIDSPSIKYYSDYLNQGINQTSESFYSISNDTIFWKRRQIVNDSITINKYTVWAVLDDTLRMNTFITQFKDSIKIEKEWNTAYYIPYSF